jgi:hypothetical protein
MTAPKPKPKPDPEPDPPEPDPEPDPDVNDGISLLERVQNLENRMAAVEERQSAPPIGLGQRR